MEVFGILIVVMVSGTCWHGEKWTNLLSWTSHPWLGAGISGVRSSQGTGLALGKVNRGPVPNRPTQPLLYCFQGNELFHYHIRAPGVPWGNQQKDAEWGPGGRCPWTGWHSVWEGRWHSSVRCSGFFPSCLQNPGTEQACPLHGWHSKSQLLWAEIVKLARFN